MKKAIKITEIEGDLAVGRNIVAGGGLDAKGSSTFHKNVRIEGFLDAPNIKGSAKGLFTTVESLREAYPEPSTDGFWALVGKSLPADIYTVKKGEWTPTGEQGGEPNLEVVAVDELQQAIYEEQDKRSEADAALREGITTESLARTDSDTTLKSLILGDQSAVSDNVRNAYIYLGSYATWPEATAAIDALHSPTADHKTVGEFRFLLNGRNIILESWVQSWADEVFTQTLRGSVSWDASSGEMVQDVSVNTWERRYRGGLGWSEWSWERKDRLQDLDIATNAGKLAGVERCAGRLSHGEAASADGLYLQEDAKGKARSLTLVEGGASSPVTPESGKLYLCGGLYYGYTGKELLPTGGGSGGGAGSGFFDVTKEFPLSGGFHTLSTAVAALRNADIDDEQKPGMVITFEVASGEWEDYRFAGTDIAAFLEPSAWESHGGKGAVKKVTVSRGASTESLIPDKSGNVELYIPSIEVDDAVDENSTNPVQGKAVAAEFKSLSGKYGSALRLNTIGEGDEKAYSLSLLSEGGEELSTTETFTGGGGGSVATTRITLTRLTPNPTVKNGDSVELSYKYDQVDTTTGESTGNSARAVVTVVRGATSSSFESTIPAGGTQKIDVTKYLGIGTNNVRVRVEVGDGEEKQVASVSWTVSVVQLTLTSSFNVATIISKGDMTSVPYALTGSGTKTLRCYVDGADSEDRSITTSTANGSFSIDTAKMAHGAHSVQLVAELELSDASVIKSNSIYFDIAVREAGNTAPIVATRFDYQDGAIITSGGRPYIPVKQYDGYTLTYAAYNPRETPTAVEVYEAGTLVSSAKVAFVTTKLDLRAMNFGTETCKIVCGATECHFNLNVEKSDLDLVEPTDGMRLKLSAQGRSNSDTNREEWTYGNVTTGFSGFKWGGDGWTGNALRHTGDARSVVRYRPLEQPAQNADNAFAFLIKYKVSEVVDDTAAVISCVDENGTGFVITPTEARMLTRGNSQLAMKMASGNVYEVGFVSFPIAVDGSSDYEKENTEMVYLYINGVMSGAVQRGTSDSIYQSVPSYINMGADGATLDVYLMRGYNTFLTDDQMLSCFILDQDTADELIGKYNSNDILDDNGNVSIENAPKGMRIVIVTGRQANGVPTVLQAAITNNKKIKFDVDEILSFVKGGNPLLNFRLIGGCISLQGTSSLAYAIKSYLLYLYNTAKKAGLLYLGCDEQGIGGILQDDAKFSFRLASENNHAAAPVNRFCTKADFAESSSSHNTGMARIVQDTLLGIGDLVPPQKYVDREKYQYDVRTTIDGEPCLFFYRGTVDETPQFLGKYNFNNDKSTEAVFGFLDIPGYHDQPWVDEKFGGENPTECWEFLNNDYPMGMFLDDDFDTKGADGTPNWMKVFEARFPDDDDINAEYAAGTRKPQYLEALVKWVRSTDTTAPGLSATARAARAEKFRTELKDYFDVDYLCDYYEFTDLFACVDQRVKNMMLAFWYNPERQRVLAHMIFYDNDTILGVRNDGRLKYHWDIDEETVDAELSAPGKTVYAFAGHDSVLWKNLREQFPGELRAAYVRIRQRLTNDSIFRVFDKEQSARFCERVYNLDAINKYVIPKTLGVESAGDGVVTNVKYSYLEAMQGDRTAHRHWFVANRAGLFDAWASTGQYTATDISFKGNSAAGATVRAVAARDFYFEFRREGETMAHDKVSKGEEWSYTYGQVANIGTIFHLLGGAWMKRVDLSDWGGFTDMNIPILPILEELVLGNNNNTYALTELAIGTKLPMLEILEIVNYTNLPFLDLSGCTRLREVNAAGCGKLSAMAFAEGAPLASLTLPSGYRTLTLRSMPDITRSGITFGDITALTGLWVENCPGLDGAELFREVAATQGNRLRYVRLPSVEMEGDGSELRQWYAAGYGGILPDGTTVENRCKIGGVYRLTRYNEDEAEMAAWRERFDELDIRQPDYTVLEMDGFVGDPAAYSNTDNRTGYKYGVPYVPSGHVKAILDRRHRVLAKMVRKPTMGTETVCDTEVPLCHDDGEMIVFPLHDEDSNYFADAADTADATPADLTGAMGEVMMYEPEYMYKGANDGYDGHRKFSCYRLGGGAPSDAEHKVLLRGDFKDKDVLKDYVLVNGEPVKRSPVTNSGHTMSYSVLSLDVAGWRRVTFPAVTGTMGAAFYDSEGGLVKHVTENGALRLADYGQQVTEEVPEGAVLLRFTVMDAADFERVVLSMGDDPWQWEPGVETHPETLVGLFPCASKDGVPMSVAGMATIRSVSCLSGIGLLTGRGMNMYSYDQHKDIVNLFCAKYGTRDSQRTTGYGSIAHNYNHNNGVTAALGMRDTVYEAVDKPIYLNTLGYESFGVYTGVFLRGVEMVANSSLSRLTTFDGGKVRFSWSNQGYTRYICGTFHGRRMDSVHCGVANGTTTTYHCDNIMFSNYTALRTAIFGRRYVTPGYEYGIFEMNGDIERFTSTNSFVGIRSMFRGKITFAKSVEEYMAAKDVRLASQE